MPEGVSLFRINVKGQDGVYACAEHIGQTDVKIDPELFDLVKILERF